MIKAMQARFAARTRQYKNAASRQRNCLEDYIIGSGISNSVGSEENQAEKRKRLSSVQTPCGTALGLCGYMHMQI